LEKRKNLQVVCEVSNGLEAVQKAEELKPDLVLLDIGLPELNGLRAAREIRRLAPESKIIFVSQESSADLVQEALGIGAKGYVAKSKIRSDLLFAVEEVLQGRQFVSSNLIIDGLA
jgi:DNA-binding NarL/FixJ family response regulator